MSAFLVTYDLNKESKRPPIVEEVRKFGTWARLSESCYVVSTSLTVEQVYGRFEKHIDQNDQLYVIPLRRPYMGFGPNDVNNWLNQHLPWGQ